MMALYKRSPNAFYTKPEKASYARDLPLNATHTELGGTLRQSVADPVSSEIIAHPNRPRGGAIAADSQIKDQLRAVSDKPITPAYGMKFPNAKAGSYGTLPAKGEATSAVAPVRKP
jgi:hypothetical protein